MKISGNDFAGTGQVYRFTLLQMLKGRANLIATLLLLLFSVASVPVMTLMMGGSKTETSNITTVYVKNETGYELALADASQRDAMFAGTTFTETDLTEETYGDAITGTEVFVCLTRDAQTNTFKVTSYMQQDAEISREELSACAGLLSALLDEARFSQQHATPAQMEILMSNFETQVQDLEEYRNPQEDDYDARFGIQMAYCILVLMLCTFVSSYIVQIVIQEKASKLSEYLLVGVRPLALLLGKILAMMTYVFGMLLVYVLAFFISYRITGLFADTSVMTAQFAALGISADSFRLSPLAVVVIVVSLLTGYLMISIFAGLLGAGCASMEDVEPANLTVVMTVLVGYMVSISAAGGSNSALAVSTSLIPVVSMFTVPVRYILGDIGIGIVILSWAVQLFVIALLAYMSAKVYRDLLLYRGGRMKIGGYFSMLRSNRKEARQ